MRQFGRDAGQLRSETPTAIFIGRLALIATGRYLRRAARNSIKILIGRKPGHDDYGSFLWGYVLHLTGIRPIQAITCVRHASTEGAGSQAHMIMNAISFARASGLAYIHTPFAQIHHADRPAPEWIADWESLFNLGAGEHPVAATRRVAVNYCYCWSELEDCFGWRNRRHELVRHFKTMIPEFRRKYYLNKPVQPRDQFTVAIHIRRGDVTAGHARYYTPTDVVSRSAFAVHATLNELGIRPAIQIYSQGDITDFPELAALDARFFLDTDPFEAMDAMIGADVLIMAQGCFSYCAGIISTGLKIFHPKPATLTDRGCLPGWAWMYVSPGDDWLACGQDGSIDREALQKRLAILREYPPGTENR